MKKTFLLLVVFCALVVSANAQKFKPKASFLEGQRLFSVEFDFNGFTLDGDSQEDFIKERLEDQETDQEKNEWTENWKKGPEKWIEVFMKDANSTAGSICKFKQETESEYTIHVKILDIDPGNFAGPFSNPAKIDAIVTITKTGSDEVLTTAVFDDVYSSIGLTPIETNRIAVSFGTFGDDVASLVAGAVE